MPDVLQEIVAHKRHEIAATKKARPAADLHARLADAPPVRDFIAALQRNGHGMRVIAEVKKASPSAGVIRENFDAVSVARCYEGNGAAALSVLTDERYFQGCLDDLTAVRWATALPILRKDFMLDRYQVLEARVAGADCVLLIAECLDDCTLRELYFYAAELGMATLIEIYEPDNLDRVLKLEPALVGVNNRNLRTFVTDLEHTIGLRPRVPSDCVLVSESGIQSRSDVERLERAGVGAILVGEALMRAPDPGAKLRELLGRPTQER
ncbi:MAG: indole-3-glycerol phosphate synthase TrpC [Planctomycetaceae bacterium]